MKVLHIIHLDLTLHRLLISGPKYRHALDPQTQYAGGLIELLNTHTQMIPTNIVPPRVCMVCAIMYMVT